MMDEELDAIEATARRLPAGHVVWYQGPILALVAEVRRLRALVAQLAPPDVTPLTEAQRRNLAAMMARGEDPGAPCEDRPDAGPTRMEIVETEALARVVGNTAAVNAARLAARVWRRYDRERDRVRELSALMELVRDALGCETWVECPERVLGLRAKVEQVNRVLTGERDVGDALLEQRDEALAEVERLRAEVASVTEDRDSIRTVAVEAEAEIRGLRSDRLTLRREVDLLRVEINRLCR